MTDLFEHEATRAVRDAVDFAHLQEAALATARRIADADGATFVLRDGEHCFYVAEDTIAPLWAGQRFPTTDCISGWSMLHREQAIVADIELDERIPVEAYRPTFVRSLVMTPLGTVDPAGAIGVYWRSTGVTLSADQLAQLTVLAGDAAAAVDRLDLRNAPWAPNFALRNTRTA